jgi:hypothetical protein
VTEIFVKSAVAAAAGVLFLWALYRHWQDGRVRSARRAAFLDDVQGLFEGGLKAMKPDGFPRISGTYRGHTFDLQVVPDTLNIRKLPALWLLVTLPEPLPVKGTFDMMMRPRGVEAFSKFAALPTQIIPDDIFPHDCAIRTDAPLSLPSRDLMKRHLPLFENQLAKELVIAPTGLRVVWLAEEGHRGKYLLYRDSEMGLSPFDPAKLRPLMDYLIALKADILDGATRAPT